MTQSTGPFAAMGAALGSLTQEKNEAYGDSFARSGEIMAILFPRGIAPDQYRDALGMVRVIDKLFRIATRKDAFGESPWKDVAGYGIVAAVADAARFPPPSPLPVEYRHTERPHTGQAERTARAVLELVPDSVDPETYRETEAPPSSSPDTLDGADAPAYVVTRTRTGGSSSSQPFEDVAAAFARAYELEGGANPGDEIELRRVSDSKVIFYKICQ